MADLPGLLGGANNFQDLTPEQKDMLRRQAISENWGPMDFITPMGVGGAVGGVVGRQVGRGMARMSSGLTDMMYPNVSGLAKALGYSYAPAINYIGRGLGGLGAFAGIGGGAEYAKQRLIDLNMPPVPKYPKRAPEF